MSTTGTDQPAHPDGSVNVAQYVTAPPKPKKRDATMTNEQTADPARRTGDPTAPQRPTR